MLKKTVKLAEFEKNVKTGMGGYVKCVKVSLLRLNHMGK